MYIFKLQISQN